MQMYCTSTENSLIHLIHLFIVEFLRSSGTGLFSAPGVRQNIVKQHLDIMQRTENISQIKVEELFV